MNTSLRNTGIHRYTQLKKKPQHHEHGQNNAPCMYYQICVFLTVHMDKSKKFCRYAAIRKAPIDSMRLRLSVHFSYTLLQGAG